MYSLPVTGEMKDGETSGQVRSALQGPFVGRRRGSLQPPKPVTYLTIDEIIFEITKHYVGLDEDGLERAFGALEAAGVRSILGHVHGLGGNSGSAGQRTLSGGRSKQSESSPARGTEADADVEMGSGDGLACHIEEGDVGRVEGGFVVPERKGDGPAGAKGKCRQSAATAAMAAIGGSAGGTLAAVRWRHFQNWLEGLSGGKISGKVVVNFAVAAMLAAMLRWRQSWRQNWRQNWRQCWRQCWRRWRQCGGSVCAVVKVHCLWSATEYYIVPIEESGFADVVSERCMLAAVWRQSGGTQNSRFATILVVVLASYDDRPGLHRPVDLSSGQMSRWLFNYFNSSGEDDLVPYFNQDASGGGVTRRQCDRTAAKSAARVAAVGVTLAALAALLPCPTSEAVMSAQNFQSHLAWDACPCCCLWRRRPMLSLVSCSFSFLALSEAANFFFSTISFFPIASSCACLANTGDFGEGDESDWDLGGDVGAEGSATFPIISRCRCYRSTASE
ncbi:hypothetical protein B0H16DRAFT_1805858 [Mycena metata]|uniref:Uncharacterized protein n=1 Tax=Mycena metata TaxID=1033252 RepID=A0AAD7NJK4_9AGAR|nr:hypothetical protein B0H16DRAFT_1805858 [Mycena metata]